MLILTRKCGQSVQIGDQIRVTVIDVSGDKIKLGIDAPKELCVLRDELLQTVSSNRQAVSGVSSDSLRGLAANISPKPALESAGKAHTVSPDRLGQDKK